MAAVVENVPYGQDHRLRKQVDAMLAAGIEVSVVTMRHDANGPFRDRPGLTLLEHAPPPEPTGPRGYALEYAWSFLCEAVALARLRRRRRIDVLQLCQPPDVYVPLAWLMRLAGARVVVDQRDLMPELLAARYPTAPRGLTATLRLLERWTQRAADRTLTVNEVLRERLVGAGGRPDAVSVVWNGPVLARVDAARAGPARGPVRRTPGESLVVWVGKMGLQDGVGLLPDLVETVVRRLQRPDLHFALLGDGECLDDLTAQLRQRGLLPWVTLTGWVPEETVFAYLASADVGLDVSQQAEVTPVKALEYMAFELPFVCFDIVETRRLADGAAVFVQAGDVEGLARALVRLTDAGDGQVLGAAGRRAVETSLSWERQVPTYLAAVGPST